MRFSPSAVERHIRREHPGCPDFAVTLFVGEVSGREWERVTLGQAVGITMQSVLRHTMTEYDALLMEGMDQKEARRRVLPRVNAMIERWSKKPQSFRGK